MIRSGVGASTVPVAAAMVVVVVLAEDGHHLRSKKVEARQQLGHHVPDHVTLLSRNPKHAVATSSKIMLLEESDWCITPMLHQ